MGDVGISVYECGKAVKGVTASLSKVMAYIKNGRWKTQVDAIRKASAIDVRELKKTLPAFTGSGMFDVRETEGLIKHSGRIVIDFDKLGDKLSEVREVLTKDPYTEYLFVSCGGLGLAVVVKIPADPTTHLKAFLTLEKYYRDTYGYKTDKSCKDVVRLRFVSCDPDLHYNPDSCVVKVQDVVEPPPDRNELFSCGRRDEDIFTVANALKRGGMEDVWGMEVLSRLIRGWGEDKQDPEKWAAEKWKNADKYQERKDDNLVRKSTEWIKSNVRPNCTFTRRDIYTELTCINDNSKAAVRGVLSGLCDQGVIEQTGRANGVYRMKDKGPARMNIRDTQPAFFEMKWPLGIEKQARLMPKNVAIIAGGKSSGKSAMMLNVALMNKDTHRVRYISSEMAEVELRFRLDQFKDDYGNQLPIEAWDNVEFFYKQSGFADLVVPDGLNVIDFMEVYDNFWLIGAMIAEVFEKLTTGIAVIGVQKAKGKEYGRGAEFTQEKARLYISLERQKIGNRAKLLEVKTPVDLSANPRGFVCDYKLHMGSRFHALTGWHEEEEKDED